jgi:hypothetical protein
MGLKGAPAYFQSVMATEVLGGLVMNICEIYLDDVIVFADTLSSGLDSASKDSGRGVFL